MFATPTRATCQLDTHPRPPAPAHRATHLQDGKLRVVQDSCDPSAVWTTHWMPEASRHVATVGLVRLTCTVATSYEGAGLPTVSAQAKAAKPYTRQAKPPSLMPTTPGISRRFSFRTRPASVGRRRVHHVALPGLGVACTSSGDR